MLPTECRVIFAATSEPGVEALEAGVDETARRHTAPGLFAVGLLALLGLTLAACSSNSTSATTADAVIHQSGTSNKTIASVDLPKKWRVTWRFNCTNPVTARPFALTATRGGKFADRHRRPDRPRWWGNEGLLGDRHLRLHDYHHVQLDALRRPVVFGLEDDHHHLVHPEFDRLHQQHDHRQHQVPAERVHPDQATS